MSIVAGCGDAAAGDTEVPAPTVASVTPVTSVASVGSLPFVDLSQAPIADDADPAVRAGAVANFVDCEYGVWQGASAPDYGLNASGPNPDEALAALLDGGMLALPVEGFVTAGVDEGRVLYTYSVGGNAKAAVVVADRNTVDVGNNHEWSVESFASCDPAEFDASVDAALPMTVWSDADGARVPTSVVTSYPGPEHCGWESATFLTLDGTAYVSDPDDVLDDGGFVASFDGDVELPANATDTGYRHGGRHLWLSQDRTIAFIVTDGSVEAWPSSTEPSYCA